MSAWRGFIKGFTAYELMAIGLISALGIASKSIVGPLAHLLTVPIGVPGGALAGGFYMMWLVLARSFTDKRGSAALAGMVQAIIVLLTGSFGSHGALTLITYTLPGFACEAFMLPYSKGKEGGLLWCSLGGLAANVAGSVASNFAFFRLPALALGLIAVTAAFSGAAGGAVLFIVNRKLSGILGR